MAAPTAEVQFAQRLAANEKKTRDKTLKKLRKYLHSRSSSKTGVSEDDLIKLWKGLHYCMWMQDKPLLQEELAMHMARLVFSFSKHKAAMLFFKVFLITEAREWNGIDQLRMDKFMMLVRRMLNQFLVLLRQGNWAEDQITGFATVLQETVLDPAKDNIPDSLRMHFADVYLPELAKVGWEQLDCSKVVMFLKVFDSFLQVSNRSVVLNRIVHSVYDAIVEQIVQRRKKTEVEAVGKNDQEQSNDGQREEGTTDEDSDSGYDDDSEPQLKYDCGMIADHLFAVGSSTTCRAANRKLLYKVVKRLRDAESGSVSMVTSEADEYDIDEDVDDAVERLSNLQPKKKRKRNKKQKDQSTGENETETEPQLSPEPLLKSKTPVKRGKKRKKDVKNTDSGGESESTDSLNVKKAKLDQSKTVSADTDRSEIVSSKSKKKKKKQKSIQKQEISPVTDKGNSLKGDDPFILDAPLPEPAESGKTTRSRKRAQKCDSDKTDTKDVNTSPERTKTESNSNVSSTVKRKKVNKNDDSLAKELFPDKLKEPLEEGEVEIWVPNKKYKEKKEKVKKTEKEKPKGSSFAHFEKLSSPPAAFVKRAISKAAKTPTQKIKDTPQLTSSEKRVKFNMKKNMAQKFEDSMTFSPSHAFNPKKSPAQGILKSPIVTEKPASVGKGKKKKKKPVPAVAKTVAKQKFTGKITRARAADFF